ncbi:hypothetical protein BKA65DRAFT_243315 [Rhexocercosporidium sp. MPI-PUGE-AT-0058]|nr:hypothetical protein BKA65DRAFT_243315 [Rhexocercosporidium sp. MPI-PUGE-AT-0058]
MHSEPSTPPTTSTPRPKMTRKPSFSSFPLTPPPSSHSTSAPQPYTPPASPIFSDPRTSTITPASTPPRSQASPFTLAHQMHPRVHHFPSPDHDPNTPHYYASNSSHPMTYTINNSLLQSLALLQHGSTHPSFWYTALNGADAALALAMQHELWDMVSKCHLFRGYILIEMRSWKEARDALTRAATIRSWGSWIEDAMMELEQGEVMDGRGISWDPESRVETMSFMLSQTW